MRYVLNRVLLAVWVPILVGASASPTTAPATAPNDAPATVITPEARALLDALNVAYRGIEAMETEVEHTFERTTAEGKLKLSDYMLGSYTAPNLFRSRSAQSGMFASDGKRMTHYMRNRGEPEFFFIYPPTSDKLDTRWSERTSVERLFSLQRSDPSLVLAMAADPAARLTYNATTVERLPDEKVDRVTCEVLGMKTPEYDVKVFIHPRTRLIHAYELSGTMNGTTWKRSGVYLTTDTEVAPQLASAYTTKAPKSAQQILAGKPMKADDFHVEQAGTDTHAHLIGKPAPDFDLPRMEGGRLKLSELRGRVIVLDFWASWCGPCMAAMPHLDALRRETSRDQVEVIAINQGEDADTALKAVRKAKVDLPVVLDQESAVSMSYDVKGIPQTVIIDPEGNVREVFVGYGKDVKKELDAAVKAAMPQR